MPVTDSQLQKYLGLQPGKRTNRVLHDLLLQPRFLGYWTFLEPKHQGVELSDVLLISGDVAFLFEAKTRGVTKPASSGWIREQLGKAVHQLNDRAAILRRGNVILRNSWRGELAFEPQSIKHLYGIVIIAADFEPFEWREIAQSAAQRAQIPIQVFFLLDFAEVLRIFDTPYDLIVYYELRASYGRKYKMLVGKEIDTFRNILGDWDQLWEGDAKGGIKLQQYLLDLSNALFQTPLANEQGRIAWAESRLIDSALRPANRKADSDSSGRRVGGPDHDIYLDALEAIAEQSRHRRSHYGRLWVEASDEAIAHGCRAFRKSHSPSRLRSYVLVATPLGEGPSETDLERLGLAAMAEHQTTSCLVLGASAASIRMAFEMYLRLIRGDESDLDEQFALVPTIVWLEQRESSTNR